MVSHWFGDFTLKGMSLKNYSGFNKVNLSKKGLLEDIIK